RLGIVSLLLQDHAIGEQHWRLVFDNENRRFAHLAIYSFTHLLIWLRQHSGGLYVAISQISPTIRSLLAIRLQRDPASSIQYQQQIRSRKRSRRFPPQLSRASPQSPHASGNGTLPYNWLPPNLPTS